MCLLSPSDHKQFEEQGYLVVPNVISEDGCEAVVRTLFDYLEMDRNDPGDWYRLPLKPGGMIEIYQHQSLWNNRQHPRMYQVFAELRGTEELVVSIDRAGFKPPQHPDHPDYDHRGFTHWDVDTRNLPEKPGMQGVLCLTDTDRGMGGFQCIPGFHKNLAEWIAEQPEDRNPFAPDLSRLPAGMEVVPIPAKAGSMIIWNSLLAHGNGHNVSNRPRFSQYISMFSADKLTSEVRADRISQWREHRPPGSKTFPGDHRAIEEKFGVTAELTALGRRLLGLDSWRSS